MSAAEIAHRLSERTKREVSRWSHQGWARFQEGAPFVPIPGLRARFLAGASPALRERIGVSAAAVLAGEFRIHGVTWPRPSAHDPFPACIWRLDPLSGQLWPGARHYCFDINYRELRERGDIKYAWDFQRLQFLQPLAAAAAWGDAAAVAAIERVIASWAAANPPFGGIAWMSGIELALRAVSLIWAGSLCQDNLSPDAVQTLGTILRAHLFWLRRFPSLHSSANNHRVAELAGALTIVSALPGTPGAATISAMARAELVHQIRTQILDDGVGAEQSPTYAAFTVEWWLCADLMARSADGLSELRGRLTAFVDHIHWLADDNGRAPNIGDDDGGRVFTSFGAPESCYPASVAGAVAARLGVPSPTPRISDPPELRDALFGASKPSPTPKGLKTFRSGGYTIARERRAGRAMRLILDHGPLGFLSIAAHGHADALAITLSLNGVDVLVDPGAYLYHSGGEWRDAFRSTLAHNTLSLNHESQSLISGPFNWSGKARARLEAVSQTPEGWSLLAEHDGYRRRWGVNHRREVRSLADGLQITDTLTAPDTPFAQASFQLGSDLSLDGEGREWRIARVGGELIARIRFSNHGEVCALSGGALGEGGWISPHFGVKLPAPRLAWRGRLAPEGLRTTISW